MLRRMITGVSMAGAMLIVACGGGPDISQVKEDFNSPSGSVKDKNAVASAKGSSDASGPAMAVAGSSGGLLGGAGLTAENSRGLQRLQASRLMAPYIRKMVAGKQAGAEVTFRQFNLADADIDFGNCSKVGNLTDTSASVSIDMSCVPGYSGTVDIEMEAEEVDGKQTFVMTQKFTNVCDPDQTCVNGDVLVEMSVSGDAMAGLAGLGFSVTSAWDISATWKEDGKDFSAVTRGGVRTVFENNTAIVETLVYAKNGAGEEVTFVLRITASETGGSISYKGGDGSIECTFTAEGDGMCTGDAELSFTDADVDAEVEKLDD